MKEFPLLSMFNIHENLLESLLELQNYADVQAVLAKYDGTNTRRHTRLSPADEITVSTNIGRKPEALRGDGLSPDRDS